jgi:thiosulfate dehydrogenase
MDDANLLAGAKVYHDHCAFCHGAPNKPADPTSAAMFPVPPQLFSADGKVTDDPEGITHWKVTNGIRLSGMPAFRNILSDMQRWQVTMLVAHAGTLPPNVQSAIQP